MGVKNRQEQEVVTVSFHWNLTLILEVGLIIFLEHLYRGWEEHEKLSIKLITQEGLGCNMGSQVQALPPQPPIVVSIIDT